MAWVTPRYFPSYPYPYLFRTHTHSMGPGKPTGNLMGLHQILLFMSITDPLQMYIMIL